MLCYFPYMSKQLSNEDIERPIDFQCRDALELKKMAQDVELSAENLQGVIDTINTLRDILTAQAERFRVKL